MNFPELSHLNTAPSNPQGGSSEMPVKQNSASKRKKTPKTKTGIAPESKPSDLDFQVSLENRKNQLIPSHQQQLSENNIIPKNDNTKFGRSIKQQPQSAFNRSQQFSRQIQETHHHHPLSGRSELPVHIDHENTLGFDQVQYHNHLMPTSILSAAATAAATGTSQKYTQNNSMKLKKQHESYHHSTFHNEAFSMEGERKGFSSISTASKELRGKTGQNQKKGGQGEIGQFPNFQHAEYDHFSSQGVGTSKHHQLQQSHQQQQQLNYLLNTSTYPYNLQSPRQHKKQQLVHQQNQFGTSDSLGQLSKPTHPNQLNANNSFGNYLAEPEGHSINPEMHRNFRGGVYQFNQSSQNFLDQHAHQMDFREAQFNHSFQFGEANSMNFINSNAKQNFMSYTSQQGISGGGGGNVGQMQQDPNCPFDELSIALFLEKNEDNSKQDQSLPMASTEQHQHQSDNMHNFSNLASKLNQKKRKQQYTSELQEPTEMIRTGLEMDADDKNEFDHVYDNLQLGKKKLKVRESSYSEMHRNHGNEPTRSSNNDDSNQLDDEDGDQKRTLRGLRILSLKVKEIVQEKGTTTYKEVAESLVAKLRSASKQSGSKEEIKDEQNIKRRVYDALNVLIASEVIAKKNKKVLAIPKTSLSGKCLKSQNWVEAKKCQEDLVLKQDQVIIKKNKVDEYARKFVALQSLIKRNERNEEKAAKINNQQHTSVVEPRIFVKSEEEQQPEVNLGVTQTLPLHDLSNKFENVVDEISKETKFRFPLLSTSFDLEDSSRVIMKMNKEKTSLKIFAKVKAESTLGDLDILCKLRMDEINESMRSEILGSRFIEWRNSIEDLMTQSKTKNYNYPAAQNNQYLKSNIFDRN